MPSLCSTGSGVSAVAVSNGGAGYIGAPAVVLSGGSGIGATAVATINPATGLLTGITITSPGSGYAPGDILTATLSGGERHHSRDDWQHFPCCPMSSGGGPSRQRCDDPHHGRRRISGISTYTGRDGDQWPVLLLISGAARALSAAAGIYHWHRREHLQLCS